MRSRRRRGRGVASTVVATALALATVPVGTPAAAAESATTDNVVIRWSEAGQQAVSDSTMGPPMVARAYAILHTCIYDAWAAYDGQAAGTRYGTILRRPEAERTQANKNEAISYAAHTAAVDVWPAAKPVFDALMADLGYPATSTTPAATVGTRACQAVLDYRHRDGSNQLGDLGGAPYSDYTGWTTPNRPMRADQPLVRSTVRDPNRWQPLIVGTGHDRTTQTDVGMHWYHVRPFAMTSWQQFTSGMAAPARYGSPAYVQQARQLVDIGANLTDEHKVISEFWADDFPTTPRPPGRWLVISKYVSHRDHHTVDDDAKMFFALTNAVFDASIAAWGVKRQYDSVRPITAIRYLYDGQRIPSVNRAGTGPELIDGASWLPYQPGWFVTPPFGDYVSGHSTFGAASAEILKQFTGSDHYGESVTYPAGSSRIEPGLTPARDVTLSWSTFTEAEAENGLSRLYAGIHFQDANTNGRALGREVAANVWTTASRYFAGEMPS